MAEPSLKEQINEPTTALEEQVTYGSFFIGQTEFALAVECIEEVVNEPELYTCMPGAPEFLLGLFNLRGAIVPVVDVQVIFGSSAKSDQNRKIAIVAYGAHCIGLLFDHAGEVLKVEPHQRVGFDKTPDRLQDTLVQSVLKLEDGTRLIQVLDPYELLNLERVPRSESLALARMHKNRARSQCLSFKVGEQVYALNIDSIQEIVSVSSIENTALSNDLCLGAFNLRGTTVPIIDFGYLLGGLQGDRTFDESSPEYKVIILSLDSHLFGLLVSSIESTLRYLEEELIPFPNIFAAKKYLISGCLSFGDGIDALLLDHNALLNQQEVEMITRGHSTLYAEKSDQDLTIDKRKERGKTYLTFSIDNDILGFDITQVVEVLDLSEDIVKPPKISNCVTGIINLRGELVTIVEPTGIFSDNPTDLRATHRQKVIILNTPGRKCGLNVDSVNSIVREDQGRLLKVPNVEQNATKGKLRSKLQYALELPGADKDQTVLLLDVGVIAEELSQHV